MKRQKKMNKNNVTIAIIYGAAGLLNRSLHEWLACDNVCIVL